MRQAPDPGTPSSNGTLVEEWELFEEVVVEAHGLLMPFVSRYTDLAHVGICQRIMDDIIENGLFNGKAA